jgi:hypothetical protein
LDTALIEQGAVSRRPILPKRYGVENKARSQKAKKQFELKACSRQPNCSNGFPRAAAARENNGIWRQNLKGGEPQRIENLPEEKLYACGWSPDGKRFAFTRGTEIRDVVLIRDVK